MPYPSSGPDIPREILTDLPEYQREMQRAKGLTEYEAQKIVKDPEDTGVQKTAVDEGMITEPASASHQEKEPASSSMPATAVPQSDLLAIINNQTHAIQQLEQQVRQLNQRLTELQAEHKEDMKKVTEALVAAWDSSRERLQSLLPK